MCFVVLPPKNVDVGSFLVSRSIATAGSLFPSCFFLWAMLLLAEDFLVKADAGIGWVSELLCHSHRAPGADEYFYNRLVLLLVVCYEQTWQGRTIVRKELVGWTELSETRAQCAWDSSDRLGPGALVWSRQKELERPALCYARPWGLSNKQVNSWVEDVLLVPGCLSQREFCWAVLCGAAQSQQLL